MLFERFAVGSGFLVGKIRDDHARHADFLTFLCQLFKAVLEEGVHIAHEHEAGVEEALMIPEPLHDACEAHAVGEHLAAGVFHDRSVSHGIGEGHADFDDVGAVLVEVAHVFPEGVLIGVAGGEEGDERVAARGNSVADFLFQNMHG